MRITAVTFGTEGDWRPLAALCHGLGRAGHEVVLLAPQPAAALAGRLGVPFEALAGDMAAELAAAMPMLLRRGGNAAALARVFTGTALRNTAAWMRAVLRHANGADAIVPAGLAIYVGLSCAEHLGIAAIGAGLQPVMPTREFASPFLPPWRLPGALNLASHRLVLALMWKAFRGAINAARVEVAGDAPRRPEWRGYPILFGLSPTLVPRPRDWPERFAVTGDWSPPLDPAWAPDAALLAFLGAGPAPVYVGFGSMLGFDPARALRIVVDALAGRRALLHMGAVGLGADGVPDSILRIGHVPHEWLLPQVREVVHHGGAGTTHAAARAGVPSVVVPFAGDQAFWAERARRLGIAPAALPHRALTATRLRARIDAACAPVFAARAREVAAAMRAEDGVTRAVDWLAERAAQRAFLAPPR